MKQRRHRVGIAVTLAMTMLFAGACSSANKANNEPRGAVSSSSNKGNQDTQASGKSAEPLGKYDPPIVVRTSKLIPPSMKFLEGESFENNVWTRAYEEELGIKVKFDWTVKGSNDQYDQKMNVTIASGDLPDIFTVNAVQLKQLVDNDQVADLTEAYADYSAALTKEIVEADGGMALKSATFDGKLFAMPYTGSAIDHAPLLWIRVDWLKKLGLEPPRTIDDLYRISEAFVKQDPDGNSKDDTFGLVLHKDLYGGMPGLEGFFNGYHAYPKLWIKNKDGAITYGSIEPEMRKALEKLREMYANGHFDREFGVKDSAKIIEMLNAGKAGLFYGGMPSSLILAGGKELNPEFDLQAFELPSADGEPTLAQVPFPINEYFVVRKGFEHPEAVVKLLNMSIDKDYGKNIQVEKFGSKDGVQFFQYKIVNSQHPKANLENYRHLQPALAAGSDEGLTPSEKYYYGEIMKFRNGDNIGWGFNRVFGPEGSQGVFDKLDKENRFLYTSFYGAPVPAQADNISTLDKMELETFTRIIMGEVGIEAFDKFVTDWKKIGGEQILKEMNEWLAKQ